MEFLNDLVARVLLLWICVVAAFPHIARSSSDVPRACKQLVAWMGSPQSITAEADYLLKKRVLNSFVTHPDGSKELLLNVAYEINPDAWKQSSSDPAYKLKQEELDLLLQEIPARGAPDWIVEFGPGDGSKARQIINVIQESNPYNKIRYTGVDINTEMLKLVESSLSEGIHDPSRLTYDFLPPINLEKSVSAKHHLTTPRHKKTLGLFLGGTLGNPPPDIRQVILKNIRAILPSGADFITGVALIPGTPELIKKSLAGYRLGPTRDLLMGPLKLLGIADAGALEIRWNARSRDIEGVFKFNQSIRLPNGLSFAPNEELLLIRSHRFNVDEIQKLCKAAGLGKIKIIKSGNFPYALILATMP